MAQDATLHVKLDSKTDKSLKKLAYEKGKSKGQLVREAITACYQASLEELPVRQSQALSAYQGGYISIGKLAKVMGMHVLEVRKWLDEHGIAQQTAFGSEDVDNA
jgi:predicted HTH domain antitoxin